MLSLTCYTDTRELRKAYLGQHVTSGASFKGDKSISVWNQTEAWGRRGGGGGGGGGKGEGALHSLQQTKLQYSNHIIGSEIVTKYTDKTSIIVRSTV